MLSVRKIYLQVIMLISCIFCIPFFSLAVEIKTISEKGLVGTFYYSDNGQKQAPVMIFGGSSGGNYYDLYQNYPEDLVNMGYAVLSLSYFDYNSKNNFPDKLRHIPLEYFKKAMDWLEDQPQTSKGEFAVLGNSRGGEAALLLATIYPKISIVIASVPSAYVGSAYDNKRSVTGSAWTKGGEEIPCVDYQKAIARYHPWWKIIDDPKEVEPFTIEVEKMTAAVLLLSGTRDRIWPSTEMSERIIKRLKKNRYPFPYKHISYDAGHNIRVESWHDIMDFLQSHFPVQ